MPATPTTTSAAIRSELLNALHLDLVGPWSDHAFAHELLKDSPTRWYLTGYLVPESAPVAKRSDAEAAEDLDAGGDSGTDDGNAPDKSAQRSLLPSSMGLSVLVRPGAATLQAEVTWGDYHWEDPSKEEQEPDDPGPGIGEAPADELKEEATPYTAEGEEVPAKSDKPAVSKPKRGYRREPRRETVPLTLPKPGDKPAEFPVPNSKGLYLVATVREVQPDAHGRLPKGTQAVSVFLVNGRAPTDRAYQSNAFQAVLRLNAELPFVARPDLRSGADTVRLDDWDEQVADLQYRNVFDYAVGLGCAAEAADFNAKGECVAVRTCWIPSAGIEFTGHLEGSALPGVELGMEALAGLASVDEARTKLGPLVEHYRAWIAKQRQQVESESLEPQRRATAGEMLAQAEIAAKRMQAGIEKLADPKVLEAFRVANRAMARQARQREAQRQDGKPEAVAAPTWRPFQLGFVLLNLGGLVDEQGLDREVVDLLFFPTGGGKTEAYLGLAAFTLVLRRLRNPGIRGAGLAVLMRYTLRLLTLDQLGRASALICALELERQERAAKGDKALGEWPFEIGLWVGSAATPNRMGRPGYTGPDKDNTAYIKTRRFHENSKKHPAPIPLENCPWCGTKFDSKSFRLVPTIDNPTDLRITCTNIHCAFTGDRPLPIVAVDEPIYRRLPAFLIATVDKFAALPWTGRVGTLFGLVDRYDQHGFYGPCEPGTGSSLGGPLPPPELIIQDELHLISGPLGTIAGVYETAIEALASRPLPDNQKLRPKIVTSTATVREAGKQIRALFGRSQAAIFPPPGPDRSDSFFATTRPVSEVPARLYVGVAAQGRSLKVVMLRTMLALLSAGRTLYRANGGKDPQNPVDPYMTLVGYFNSLRELGGSRRIVEDEVRSRLEQYYRRRRLEPEDRLFSDRKINYEPLELTSRVPTNKVADAKRCLALPFSDDDRVDVALATNMISVGLDITRLGLMVVVGQPKTAAEYIQATSRVGRDPNRPGLVITLLNVHKPRDRSHYERFGFYHAAFYRNVEATSVTPFSPRALDRALAAALVGYCRHQLPQFTPPLGAAHLRQATTAALEPLVEAFTSRAERHRQFEAGEASALREVVRQRCVDLLHSWFKIATYCAEHGGSLQYGTEEGGQSRLLRDPLEIEHPAPAELTAKFRANRSMRDVEASVDLFPQTLND